MLIILIGGSGDNSEDDNDVGASLFWVFCSVFLNNVLCPRQSYGNDIGGEPYYCTGIQIIK